MDGRGRKEEGDGMEMGMARYIRGKIYKEKGIVRGGG